MGADEELYETRDSGGSRYLYGKIIQETCPSRYSADLAIAELVKTRIYCITVIWSLISPKLLSNSG